MIATYTALGFGSYLWMGLSLGVVALAAQLTFAWIDLAIGSDRRSRLIRQAGAGVGLGTGIWAAHGVGASVQPLAFVAGYRPLAEVMVWLLSVGACTIAIALSDLIRSRLQRAVFACCALASTVVAVQMMGLLAGQWRPGIFWDPLPLLLAGLTCAAGAALCIGLLVWQRGKGPSAMASSQTAASLSLGAAVVLAQHLVAIGAGLSSQTGWSVQPDHLPGSSLTALALLGSGCLLLGLQRGLRIVGDSHAGRTQLGAQHLNDPLTRLPGRQRFEGLLTQNAKRADAARTRLAVLVINLDGFEPINRLFGAVGGDRMLCEVAARLRGLCKPHMAARLTGDEFVCLLADDPGLDEASAFASRVVDEIGRSYLINGRKISISCSVGVVMYPEHGALSTLVAHAQAAMVTAKAAGGGSHSFYEQRMLNNPRDDKDLLRDLRLALDRNQLELFYQPKIHAPTGEVTGAEALLRWHHPRRGMVNPALFIPLAERYGLVNALGRWVIGEACRQVRAWRDNGLRMRVAVNLSTHQLCQSDLAQQISTSLRHHQINPDLITCEITESAAMQDTDITTRVLGELDKVGVHISIDDFGTGHSSLAYLRKLPADELKIDRSFVLELETSEEARKVASAVVNLAKSLNLKVVAEGVETKGQNRILREFGCDQLQGYLFAKPMSAKALAVWAMEDVGPRTMSFRSSLFKDTLHVACA